MTRIAATPPRPAPTRLPTQMTARRARARAQSLTDPRWGQIAALSALAVAGYAFLGFNASLWQPPAALAAALATQWAACRTLALPFDPLSPAITALSLTILLRVDTLWLVAPVAAAAVLSKFVLRVDGRHIVNPAAFALVVAPTMAAALGAAAWVSPGQWGPLGVWAVLVAGVGATVAGRAARLDTTLAFLAVWTALVFGRAAWFGDPMVIPLHQIQAGAVLVFAFHMISDPATTPQRWDARLLHAAAVALLGFWLTTAWISDTGPILALVLLAPIVAILNRRFVPTTIVAPPHLARKDA